MTPTPMLAALRGFLDRYQAALLAGRDRLDPEARAGLRGELARLRATYPLDQVLAGSLVDPEAEEARAELSDYLVSEEGSLAGSSRPADPIAAEARAMVLAEVVAPVLAGLPGPRVASRGPGLGSLAAWGLAGLFGLGLLAAQVEVRIPRRPVGECEQGWLRDGSLLGGESPPTGRVVDQAPIRLPERIECAPAERLVPAGTPLQGSFPDPGRPGLEVFHDIEVLLGSVRRTVRFEVDREISPAQDLKEPR